MTKTMMTPQVRDALRLGLQSAVAAASFYALHRTLSLNEAFVGILSAVLIVQPSIGSTVDAGLDRFVATVMGSIIGLVCLLIVPHGYGTAAALFVSMFAVNSAAGVRPDWRYGVVAAVAISLGADDNALQTAFDRSIAIALGVVIGLAVSFIIWPDKAEKRAQRHLKACLEAIGERLDGVLARFDDAQGDDAASGEDKYHRVMSDAQEAVAAIKGERQTRYIEAKNAITRLYTGISVLNRVSENDDVVSTSKTVAQETMDTIRSRLRAQIKALADTDGAADGLDLEEQLTRLEGCDGETSENLSIIRFALKEIVDDLSTVRKSEIFA